MYAPSIIYAVSSFLLCVRGNKGGESQPASTPGALLWENNVFFIIIMFLI